MLADVISIDDNTLVQFFFLENFAITYDTDIIVSDIFVSDTFKHKILISCGYRLDVCTFNIC